MCHTRRLYFLFFNDTATTEIYTLSLHDALPIFAVRRAEVPLRRRDRRARRAQRRLRHQRRAQDGSEGLQHLRDDLRRSEEHTSELQSRQYLVCRLLLEKKN